jgi:ABC-type transporter Mla subunit MlaD
LRSTIIYANAKTKTGTKGTEMSRSPGQQSTNTLRSVVDLLVEHRVKLDALEHVLKETNPLVHELYLGTIENLQAQKTAEVNRLLTQTFKSKRPER